MISHWNIIPDMGTLKIKVALISFFAFFLLFAPTVFAQTPESFGLVPQKTLPGGSAYTFKRLKEKIMEFFKFSHDSKFTYRQELLGKRVSEYVSLIENKNQLELTGASQRVAYEAGVLAESANSSDEKVTLVSLFGKYKPIMAKMRDNFPANSPSWLLSQEDIDSLDILTGKLK